MWRLIISIILFLLSLLTVFKAPTNFFWRVAVAVTEFPYIPTEDKNELPDEIVFGR